LYRLINLVGAIFLLIILAPIILLVSIAIRLDSRGPAIFKQTRMGQFDSHFTLYKFRSMHVGTPDIPSEMVKKDDRRFTGLGRFLRRFSIDELPQLLNIIRGDMNFIGPRPALYNQDRLIKMRKELGVNKLKPGVTGWAQVNGRENISLERKVELDKYYLEKRSLGMDVKIIWLTLVKSLGGVDLYIEKAGGRDKLADQSKNYHSSV